MTGFCLLVLLVAVALLVVKHLSLARTIEDLHRRLNSVEDELHRVGKIADAHTAGAPGSPRPESPRAPPSLVKMYPAPSVPPPLPPPLPAPTLSSGAPPPQTAPHPRPVPAAAPVP